MATAKLGEFVAREAGVAVNRVMLLRHSTASMKRLREAGVTVKQYTEVQPRDNRYNYHLDPRNPIEVVVVLLDDRVEQAYRVMGKVGEGTNYSLNAPRLAELDKNTRPEVPAIKFRLEELDSCVVGQEFSGWDNRQRTTVQRSGDGFFSEILVELPSHTAHKGVQEMPSDSYPGIKPPASGQFNNEQHLSAPLARVPERIEVASTSSRQSGAPMQQQNVPISALVDMYKRGELRLPEIQRNYVWRATRVRDLLDSLYRGYPSGSILMWETDEPVPTREGAIAQDSTAFAGRKLLLDGQQRITSLTAVVNGDTVKVRGRKKPIDILFNLEHHEGPPSEVAEVESDIDSPLEAEDDDEEDDNGDGDLAIADRFKNFTFVVASRNLAAQPNWVSVSEVLKATSDAPFLKKAGVTSFEDPRYQRYTERLTRLRQIRNYQYVVHVLERGMNYQEVTEIFVRVNSLGAKLRSSDLALAQITSRWPNLLKELEEFQEECEQSWFTIDLGQLVRAIVVFATKQCLFHTVGKTPITVLRAGWEEAKEGLRFAINFLRTNAGIEDESLLSSPMFIHVLAAVSRAKGNRISQSEQQALLHWLLVANARGHFSRGSTEGLLNEDLNIVFRSGDLSALLEPLKRQFGRLHVEPSDFAKRGVAHPLFSIAYLALKAGGAKDWYSGLGLSLTHQGRLHYIQWHHVIPKSLLKDHDYETGEINEIANMAFITGQTNRRISNKDAKKYLQDVVNQQGSQALESQCVPTDATLWDIERYRDFLQYRREALASRVNAFIREKAGLSE